MYFLSNHDNSIKPIEDKVFPYVDEHGFLDDEYMSFTHEEQDYPFTLDDFRKLTTYIWDKADGWNNPKKYAVEDAYFETYHVPCMYDGKKYVLNIMYGDETGFAWTLMTEARHNVYKEEIREFDELIGDGFPLSFNGKTLERWSKK